MGSSLREFPEVYWPLSVAKRSVEALHERNHEERNLDEEMRHSAIVIVFAAAAVEAAMNSFISRPLLEIADPGTREFFAKLLHRHSRANAPAKLDFLKLVYPEIKHYSELLTGVRNLAAARNALMHIYPDYLVALGPKPDADWPLKEEDWIEYADLQWTKQHVANPHSALNGYSTALQFIDKLPMSLTPYELMRTTYDSEEPAAGDAGKQRA